MAAGVGFLLGLIAVVFLQHATAQTVYDVGDTTGWTVPQGGASFYSDWAANKNFHVGDTLRFNFETNRHDVLKVSKELFDTCDDFDNSDNDIMTTSPVTMRLNDTGMNYFVCTVGAHCSSGQKLSINVVAATAGGPMSPTSPGPPSSSLLPPPRSSSNALTATLYLTFSALLMAFF